MKKHSALIFLLCLSICLTGCGGGGDTSSQPVASQATSATTTASSTSTPEDTNIIDKTDAYSGSQYSNPDNVKKFEGLVTRIKTNLESNGIKVLSDEEAAEYTAYFDILSSPEQGSSDMGIGVGIGGETGGIPVGGAIIGGDTGTSAPIETEASSEVSGATIDESSETSETAETEEVEPEVTKETFDYLAWAEKAVDNTLSGKSMMLDNAFPEGLDIEEEDYMPYYEAKLNYELLHRVLDANPSVTVDDIFGGSDSLTGTAFVSKFKSQDANRATLNMKQLPSDWTEDTMLTNLVTLAATQDGSWVRAIDAPLLTSFGGSSDEIRRGQKLAYAIDYTDATDNILAHAEYSEFIRSSYKEGEEIRYKYTLTSIPWGDTALVETAATRWVENTNPDTRGEEPYVQERYTKYGMLGDNSIRLGASSMLPVTNWSITSTTKSDEFTTGYSTTASNWGIPAELVGVEGVYVANQYIYVPTDSDTGESSYLRSSQGTTDSLEAGMILRYVSDLLYSVEGSPEQYPELLEYFGSDTGITTFISWYSDLMKNETSLRLLRLADTYMKEQEALNATESVESSDSETSEVSTNDEVPAEESAPSATESTSPVMGIGPVGGDTTGIGAVGSEPVVEVSKYAEEIERLGLVEAGIVNADEQNALVELYLAASDNQRLLTQEYTREAIEFALENIDLVNAQEDTLVYDTFVRELKSLMLLKSKGYIYLTDDCVLNVKADKLMFDDDAERLFRDNGDKLWTEVCKVFNFDNSSYSDLSRLYTSSNKSNVCDYAVTFTNGGVSGTIVRGDVVDALDWFYSVPIISGTITESELRATLLNYIVYVGTFTGESYSRCLDVALSGLVNKTIEGSYIFSIDYFNDVAILGISKG